MSQLGSINHWARVVREHMTAQKPDQQATSTGVWHWVNSVAQGIKHLFSGPLSGFAKVVGIWGHYAFWWDREAAHGIRAGLVWIVTGIHKWLAQYVNKRLAALWAALRATKRQLVADIIYALRVAEAFTIRHVSIERKWRLIGDRWLYAEIKTRVKWLHQAIEREAISGYKASHNQRLSTIERVADLIANNNPFTRALVKRLVTGILDLAVVDDPAARLVLSFVLRHIVDRLGLDKVLGHYLQALLQPLLGAPRPRGLSDVIADICARLDGIEGQWAEFMANGGPEVEQAGREWQGLVSLIGDAALLGFVAEMCYRPEQFGQAITGTAGKVINDTIIGATELLRKV